MLISKNEIHNTGKQRRMDARHQRMSYRKKTGPVGQETYSNNEIYFAITKIVVRNIERTQIDAVRLA